MMYTQGPWYVVDKGRGFAVFSTALDEPPTYKTGKRAGQRKWEPKPIRVVDGILIPAIADMGDALLIAAAPDLLEACKAALEAMEQDQTWINDTAKGLLESAISRAEGK